MNEGTAICIKRSVITREFSPPIDDWSRNRLSHYHRIFIIRFLLAYEAGIISSFSFLLFSLRHHHRHLSPYSPSRWRSHGGASRRSFNLHPHLFIRQNSTEPSLLIYTVVFEYQEPSEATSTLLETSEIRFTGTFIPNSLFFFYLLPLLSHLESCAENLDEASRVLRFLSSFILLCFLQSDSNHIGQSGLDLRMERQHLFIFLDFHAISARLFVIFFLFLYFCYPNATVGVVASVCIYVYVKKTKMHLCYKTPDEKR